MVIDALAAWLASPVTWIMVLVIGTMGDVVKSLVLGPKASWPKDGFRGWRGVYLVTYKAHGLAVGAAIGLIPGLPIIADLRTEGIAGSVIQYCGDGALAMLCYTIVVGNLKTWFKHYGGGSGNTGDRDSAAG